MIDKYNICKDYKDGLPLSLIMDKYSINWSTLYEIIHSLLANDDSNVTAEQIDEIIELYKSGCSTTKIGARYGIYHKVVSKILEDNRIPRIGVGNRKWVLNEKYFHKIDTQDKAYILGFLYADGYNCPDKSTIRLELQESDKEILEKISFAIGSNKPLKFIKCDDHVASNGYISKNMYQLEIYSKNMCHDLILNGCVQNKSLILKFPENLSSDLYSHFIRGYFDGDGSYCCRYAGDKYGYRHLVTITSTNDFCNSVLNILHDNSVIAGGCIYDASCHNGITKVLTISGKNQCKNFLDYIYQDANLYLDRKYQKYINALTYLNNIA